MIGTFLTTYAAIRGATELGEEIQNTLTNPVGTATDLIKKNTPGIVNQAVDAGKKVTGVLGL